MRLSARTIDAVFACNKGRKVPVRGLLGAKGLTATEDKGVAHLAGTLVSVPEGV